MHNFKITVITVSYNAENTIEQCIQSVISQKHNNIEYIIIDGGSTDSTVPIIQKYQNDIQIIISEPDNGIYHAMNKGIALATGNVIGILNADDVFADDLVLTEVHNAFAKNGCDIVYGNLHYIKPDGQIIRKWISSNYKRGMFNLGWMPPHPTFYCKKQLFDKLGDYSLDFGTAADYELMMRFIHVNLLPVYYVQKVLVKMRVGGVSNKNINNRFKAMAFDIKAMYKHKLFFPPVTLILKPLLKIKQYF